MDFNYIVESGDKAFGDGFIIPGQPYQRETDIYNASRRPQRNAIFDNPMPWYEGESRDVVVDITVADALSRIKIQPTVQDVSIQSVDTNATYGLLLELTRVPLRALAVYTEAAPEEYIQFTPLPLYAHLTTLFLVARERSFIFIPDDVLESIAALPSLRKLHLGKWILEVYSSARSDIAGMRGLHQFSLYDDSGQCDMSIVSESGMYRHLMVSTWSQDMSFMRRIPMSVTTLTLSVLNMRITQLSDLHDKNVRELYLSRGSPNITIEDVESVNIIPASLRVLKVHAPYMLSPGVAEYLKKRNPQLSIMVYKD